MAAILGESPYLFSFMCSDMDIHAKKAKPWSNESHAVFAKSMIYFAMNLGMFPNPDIETFNFHKLVGSLRSEWMLGA